MKHISIIVLLNCSALLSQNINLIEKYVLGYENKCLIVPKSNLFTDFIQLNQDGKIINVDTVYLTHALLETKIFEKHPMAWDVSDSLFFWIRLYGGGTSGMILSQIVRYDLSVMSQISGEELARRLLYGNTIFDNFGTPLDKYTMQLQYKATDDTITKGPIFFDFHVNQTSFMLYVYLGYLNKIEVWDFVHYPLRMNAILSTEAENNLRKRHRWEKIGSIPVENPFTAPFRIIHTKGKTYLVTNEGEIFRIEDNRLVPTNTLPEGPERTLVIDKDLDEVYHIERALLLRDDDKPLRDKLRESAVQILHDH